MPYAICDVEYSGAAATRARLFARDTVRSWHLESIALEAEMVTTELVTNAVLHGLPPISVELGYDGDSLRIAVGDASPTPPVSGMPGADAMTGRGLNLVASLSAQWGVASSSNGEAGKVVWAEIGVEPRDGRLLAAEQAGPEGWPARTPADGFGDRTESDGELRYDIVLGDVPTDLLVAAKAHVDNIVRELTLASYGPASGIRVGHPGRLGGHLIDLLADVVVGFSEARQAIKRQAIAAARRGDERTRLSLRVGPSMADAGERYLAALDQVDDYARAARLLTVESPPQHRAFRHWYVQSLVDQLRAKVRGEPAPPAPTFEQFLLGEVASIAAAHRVSDRAARLQRVTAALATAITPADVANVTVAECVRTVDAGGGALLLLDDAGRLGVVGAIGSSEASGLAIELGVLVDRALASGRPVWIESLPMKADTVDAVIVGAACAVPIAIAGEVIGMLALSYLTARVFDADDRAFIEAVAAEAAQTLTRTRLHEEQVQLSYRLARLQSVAGELARRSDLMGVCEAAVRHATSAVDARIGAVCLPTVDRRRLRIVDMQGDEANNDEQWREFAVDGAFPAAVAFRRGEPVVIDATNRHLPEFAAYPQISHLLVCLPLRVDDDVSGVLTLSFPESRTLNAADIRFLTALSDVCAQALARAQALERATRVGDRFAFLAEASRQLALSLNYEETLQAVADLAVPELADWCGIDLLEGDEIRSVAVAHVDPGKVAFARLLRSLYPEDADSGVGVARVITTGESLLVPCITDEMLVARATDDRELEMIRGLGMSAVLIVPLRAGGRVVGALSLIRTHEDRPFGAGDVTLSEDLGSRAGTAVENARLFREVQAAWHSDSGTSHARLDLALAAASIGSFDWDLPTGSLGFDDRACTIFGVDRVTFDNRVETILGMIAAEDRQEVEAVIDRAVSRLGDFRAEYRIRRPDSTVRWIDTRGRVLPGTDGRGSRVIGVAFDSTELREARDRVARTLEHMGDAFYSLDAEWRVTYVNATAERLLGRDRNSLLGRNLWDALPDMVGGIDERAYRRAIETQRPVAFERFVESTGHHFEVRVQPIPEGLGVYFTDISESRQFEQERAELREASRHARSMAEVARARLSFIAEVSADITTTLDPVEVCRRLATHAVGRLADWVSVYVLDGDQCHRVAAAHRDPRWAAAVAALVDHFPIDVSSEAMVARAVRSRLPVLEQHMLEKMISDTYPDPAGRALVEGMGVASAFVIPMIARTDVVGVMAFIRSDQENEFEPDELQLATALASRAALAVQNAQLYERQTTVAQALQQAVLPDALPLIETVQLSAKYEPALGGAGVGGDFYDVFRLPSGRIALAVGDAAGHGLEAGALMGQLRNALRAYAVQEQGPVATLRSLSDLIAALEPDAFATAFYAELDPVTGELSWANAGHPPPLLTFPDQSPRYLDGLASPPLGVFAESEARGGAFLLPAGGGIFLYTDGLIERRRMDITDGLDALRQLVGSQRSGLVAVDDIVAGMREESGYSDDVCVLFAVRSR